MLVRKKDFLTRCSKSCTALSTMSLKSITPKFIRRILTLREYRITKATIKYIKTDRIPTFEDLYHNYGSKKHLRTKDFYETWYNYYKDQLIQNEGRLEDLQHEMRELCIQSE